MVTFKRGVQVRVFRPELVRVLAEAALWSLTAGVAVEINSINDSDEVRPKISLHRYDLAVDIDTIGDSTPDLKSLFAHLRRTLSPQYDVVFEDDHVHVEWDARRGPSPLEKV